MSETNRNAEHRAEWTERLEDLLDNALSGTEHARVTAHVDACEICRQDLAALRSLDETLRVAIKAPALAADFDATVLARIASLKSTPQSLARERAEQEHLRASNGLADAWRTRKRRLLLDSIAAIGTGTTVALVLHSTSLWSAISAKLPGISTLNGIAIVAVASTVVAVIASTVVANVRR